jgi:ferric-dicitrate binding protein FerR (iron transport regulator)
MSEINTIIQKYLQGKTSEEENHQLHQWIQQSPENKKRLFVEKDIWDSYSFHANEKRYETAPELEILKTRIEFQSRNSSIRLTKILQIAAILLIAFGLGWSSQFISFEPKNQIAETTMQEIFVPKGQVNQIFLADGTRIWINSETRLTLPSVFAPNERVVKLNGEAFFEVAKDKNRPFKVEVKGQQIKVFGTSFNVRAYENSNKIETTLETGSIQLRIDNQTTMLNPGEQSLFNKTEKNLVISKVEASTFSSWKDGRFEFQNEDLVEVFKVVERWYDVDINYDENTFRGMHFSGVIKRNKDVNHFLEILNLSVPIRYEINSDKIKITSK